MDDPGLQAYFTENPTFQVAVSWCGIQPVPCIKNIEPILADVLWERIFMAREPVQRSPMRWPSNSELVDDG